MLYPARRNVLPFTAIVGQETMKRALLPNAVNPGIGGVLIRGEKWTAKSIAVRALADVLPEIDVVRGCPYSCDPAGDGGLSTTEHIIVVVFALDTLSEEAFNRDAIKEFGE